MNHRCRKCKWVAVVPNYKAWEFVHRALLTMWWVALVLFMATLMPWIFHGERCRATLEPVNRGHLDRIYVQGTIQRVGGCLVECILCVLQHLSHGADVHITKILVDIWSDDSIRSFTHPALGTSFMSQWQIWSCCFPMIQVVLMARHQVTPLKALNDALHANPTEGQGKRDWLAAFTWLTMSSGFDEEDLLLGCKEWNSCIRPKSVHVPVAWSNLWSWGKIW